MDLACRFAKTRGVVWGHGTRSRVVVKAVDPDTVSRRDGIIKSLGVLSAGLLMAFDAEARTDPYYDELLSNTKGLDTADLLSKYKKMSSSEGGKKKKGTIKSVRKGGSGKGSTSSSFSTKPSKGSAAGPAVNPVEVGLGLAGLAGVVAIGQQGSKGGASSSKKASSPPKPKTQKKKVPTGTVRLSAGTTRKAAAAAGTQRKATAAAGTQRKTSSGTKKVGTVTRKTQGKQGEKSESSNGAAPALLVGLVAVIGAFVAVGSKPISEEKPAIVKKEPSPVVEQKIPSKTPSEQKPVADAPIVAAPPLKSDIKGETTAPVVAAKEEKSTSSPNKSKLPPTTGNSPIVLIGGSIATLIVAAAVAGGSENTDAATVQGTSAPSAGQDDAALRKKEAREWIEAWRSKQK
mmetsp:Transcript_13361/g.26640  ORF Transcript_13361/g.26640 Transcript_13361/m.26640 type:complete len:403 (+) Transcript_13361:78-1286(+)